MPTQKIPQPGESNLRVTVSEDFLRKLRAPKSGKLYHYDGNPRGFGVSVTSTGIISFILDYRIFGRSRRITLGRWPEMSVKEARAEAEEARRILREGTDPMLARQLSRKLRTVNDLAREYLERYAEPRKKPSSIRGDKLNLEIVKRELGRMAVAAVTPQDIQNLHQSMKATPYRANRVIALLSKMFRLAVQWHVTEKVWRSDSPVVGIQKFHEEKRTRWLNDEELARLRNTLNEFDNHQAANAVRLILLTGSRKNEVLQAKWEHFDLRNGIWTKPYTNTKQKRTEYVPLSPEALKLLKKMQREAASEFLFPSQRLDSRPLENIKQHWKAICEKAKLPGVRIHDLRHSFASHLVSNGTPLEMVGKLLGHTQKETTQRYAHLAQAPLREAAAKFGKVFAHAKSKSRAA